MGRGPRRKAGSPAGDGDNDDRDVMEISVPNDALFRELSSHNSFFDALVDMLPAKMYVSGHPTGDEAYNPKYRKGQHKESKEARKARNKAARRDKFDPQRAETTLQTKRRLDREEQEEEDDDDSESGDEVIVDAHEEEDEEEVSGPPGANKATSSAPLGDNASRIEALRARLRAKIAERQAARPGAGDPSHVSKRAARRAEKRKRVEEAKKRRAQQGGGGGGASEVTKKKAAQYKMAGGGTRVNASDPSVDGGRTQDLAGVDFGSIAGLHNRPAYLDNKSLSGAGKKKSLDRLLAEAEKKAERLKQLKASGDEDDKARAKSIEWGDTLKEATGQRVRDDPSLIKKAMKRKAKKKERSAKAWRDRTDATREKMDERQKIRGHNLDRRKMGGAAGANLSKKRIKTDDEDGVGGGGKGGGKEGGGEEKKKRPRLGPHSGKGRAGFEGRKADFINGGKAKGGDRAAAQ